MKKPDPPADIWAFLDSQMTHLAMPDGAITIKQFAAKYGMSHSAAFSRLRGMEQSGMLKYLGRFGCRNERCYIMAKPE